MPHCQAGYPPCWRPCGISIRQGPAEHAGRVRVVTEYYQQLPDGALVEVKPLPEGERAAHKAQDNTASARGAREPPSQDTHCCTELELGSGLDTAKVLHCCC